VDDLKKVQDSITSFLQDRKADLLAKIATEGKLDDATEADLKAALDEYKSANKQ
jgi:F0F1-type ATP synthase alpha subunit